MAKPTGSFSQEAVNEGKKKVLNFTANNTIKLNTF
jgi:hypothetical protein